MLKVLKKNGFTLVELLVTISIAALLMIVAIPGFRNYTNVNEVTNTAKLIQSEIYKARSLALAPEVSKNKDNDQYEFLLISETSAKGNYKMQINEVGGATRKLVEEVWLPRNITVNTQIAGSTLFQVRFSIAKYAKITSIYSTIGNNGSADYMIEIMSSKLSSSTAPKQIILNKVTGQVYIPN